MRKYRIVHKYDQDSNKYWYVIQRLNFWLNWVDNIRNSRWDIYLKVDAYSTLGEAEERLDKLVNGTKTTIIK